MRPNEEALFAEALEKQDPQERAAFLDRACAADGELRNNVESLLAAYEAGQFLEGPGPSPYATLEQPNTERPGMVIGPYKLLQQIGGGGMGTVFMAEQSHPVQRQVALKVIKPGMDSRQVLARFEAERQALALMDHPNIARVLDAGTTDSGRPYFVMELVKGVPITRYSDERHLQPRERLELFIPVCQAVQHAHQKGIIHRDLKPSNVLVADYDDKPMAKVIDFGVAKATGGKLTDRTMFTEFGQVVGTLEYMSPEQAKLNALDIDTRSDVYALGVLLYELLTGTTPFEKNRLRSAAFDEVLRMIREEEPPRPSTRLSTTKELPSIAANRGLEPKILSGLVRGELDWIAMKCLEKDRSRRYETANGLAMDLRRYLADDPVLACPPSTRYALYKFARRHTRGLAATVLVFALLAAAVVVLVVFNYQITQQRNLAQREHERAEANLLKARAAVDDYLTTVSENTLLKSSLPGLQPLRKELLHTAMRYYQGFVRDHHEDPNLRFELAAATFRVGAITAEIDSPEKGLELLVDARELIRALAAAQPSRADYGIELGRCLMRIGYVSAALGKTQDAMASYEQGIEILEALTPDHSAENLLRSALAFGHHRLSKIQVQIGLFEAASQHGRRAIELEQQLADANPTEPHYRSDLAQAITNLSFVQFRAGLPLESLNSALTAETIERALVQEQPWDAATRTTLSLCLRAQANILRSLGRKDVSLDRFRESAEIMDELTAENPADIDCRTLTARSFSEYAQQLVDADRMEPAQQALVRAQHHAEIVKKANPMDFQNLNTLSSVYRNRGKILGKQGKFTGALDELQKALAIDERIAPHQALFRYDLACTLAQLYAMAGRLEAHGDADRYGEKAVGELRKAWDQGYKALQDIERDPDLDALRSRPDFKAFLESTRGAYRSCQTMKRQRRPGSPRQERIFFTS